MSNIDKRALREAAEKALPAMKRLLMMPNDELFDEALLNVDGDVDAANAFNLLTGPETMLALLDELEAKEKRIAELESREVNGRFPLPKDSSQGWKIDPEFISKIQDAIGHDEECQCWEGSPSMEMVEVVLIAAAAIKMDERG